MLWNFKMIYCTDDCNSCLKAIHMKMVVGQPCATSCCQIRIYWYLLQQFSKKFSNVNHSLLTLCLTTTFPGELWSGTSFQLVLYVFQIWTSRLVGLIKNTGIPHILESPGILSLNFQGPGRNVWSMKWRLPGQRKLGEKLCRKTVRHVSWTGRMPWIIIDEGSR